MPLFLVEVTFTVPVLAESQTTAEEATLEDWAEAEIKNNGLPDDSDAFATPMTDASGSNGEGDLSECIPWGGGDERTIAQILESEASDG